MGRVAASAARCAAIALLLPAAATADQIDQTTPHLTGRQIYERVVANRFGSFVQHARLISSDRTGRSQESRFEMKWRDYRNGDGDSADGIVSKTLVRYTHPFDLRHAGYLVLAREDRSPDQFIYYPSRRRIVRVSLRKEAVYGTDFSFEDVVPREVEEFAYRRLSDEVFEGVPVHVVQLFPKEFADSEYSRIRVYVDEQRFVVVRAFYWDDAGVPVKELRAPPRHVKAFGEVFVPMQATMRNLRSESRTRLVVEQVEPDVELPDETFDVGKLETH